MSAGEAIERRKSEGKAVYRTRGRGTVTGLLSEGEAARGETSTYSPDQETARLMKEKGEGALHG